MPRVNDAVLNGKIGEQVAGPARVPLVLVVNGRRVTVDCDPATTLVQVLRDSLGLTGTESGATAERARPARSGSTARSRRAV